MCEITLIKEMMESVAVVDFCEYWSFYSHTSKSQL